MNIQKQEETTDGWSLGREMSSDPEHDYRGWPLAGELE